MKSEEEFNKNVLYVLKKIKERSFYSPKKNFIPYYIYKPIPDNFISESCPSSLEESLILDKLNGLKVIKLHRPSEIEMFEFIEIIKPKFDNYCKKLGVFDEKKKEEQLEKKVKLNSQKIEFNDDEALIKIGKQNVALPPYKNEHYFCRAAFEYPTNEPIDWSIIYEKMTGYYEKYYGKPMGKRENWRIVYDTAEALNKRIKDMLGINKLFIWQEKTVRRTQ